MKKLLSTILLSVIPVFTAFGYDFMYDGICYNITSSNTVEVAASTYKGDIVIPESVTYTDINYSVTSIGGKAFYKCSGLTSITIPNSVTSIGVGAFRGCI